MSTLRELAAESIGRITRRGLEPQLAQVDGAVGTKETVVAVAPGQVGSAGVLVVVTDARLLVSTGEPFAKPVLDARPLGEVRTASAAADGDAWRLDVEHADGALTVAGMFDRDARRLAALLDPADA